MIIQTSSYFNGQYSRVVKKRPEVRTLFVSAMILLQENPRSPSLKTHKLKGDLDGYWSFSLSYDLRVIFEWKRDAIWLVNIGTHDELY